MQPIKIKKRIDRPMTSSERSRHRKLIAEFEADRVAISARGRAAIARHDRLVETLSALKAERKRLGLSLTELAEKSGIDRARLSRLERSADANPTIDTLGRLAAAMGKDILITLVDKRAKAG